MKKYSNIFILCFLLVGTACGSSSESSSSSESIDALNAREILENVIDLRNGPGLTYAKVLTNLYDVSTFHEIGSQYSQQNYTSYEKKQFSTDYSTNFDVLKVFYRIYTQDNPQIKQSYDGQLVTTEKTDDQSYHCRQFSVDENNELNLSRDETLTLEEMESDFFPAHKAHLNTFDLSSKLILNIGDDKYVSGSINENNEVEIKYEESKSVTHTIPASKIKIEFIDTQRYSISMRPYNGGYYINEFCSESILKPLTTYYLNEITNPDYFMKKTTMIETFSPTYISFL